jgi:hypothetical protein
MVSRIAEQYIVKAVMNACVAAYGTCQFYSDKREPKIIEDRYAQIKLQLSDEPTRSQDHLASGLITIIINAKTTLKDIYAATKIADALANTFKNQGVAITSGVSTIGYLRGKDPISRALGIVDGVISHFWQIDFAVYSTA